MDKDGNGYHKCTTIFPTMEDLCAVDEIQKCCSLGAIELVRSTYEPDTRTIQILFDALNETVRFTDFINFVEFNDYHSHAEVMKLWKNTGKRMGVGFDNFPILL